MSITGVFFKDWRIIVAALGIISIALSSCAAGGKGLSRPKMAMRDSAADLTSLEEMKSERNESYDFSTAAPPAPALPVEPLMASDAFEESIVHNESESMDKMPAIAGGYNSPALSDSRSRGELDPFGILPTEWPEELLFHPMAIIVDGGPSGISGYYITAIIPGDQATPMGVQNFHLTSIADWETIQVREEYPVEGNTHICTLFVNAEKPGMIVEICTGTLNSSIMEKIPPRLHAMELVGPDPIWEKISYDTKHNP